MSRESNDEFYYDFQKVSSCNASSSPCNLTLATCRLQAVPNWSHKTCLYNVYISRLGELLELLPLFCSICAHNSLSTDNVYVKICRTHHKSFTAARFLITDSTTVMYACCSVHLVIRWSFFSNKCTLSFIWNFLLIFTRHVSGLSPSSGVSGVSLQY
jgi:hypothetical protein